MMNTNEGMPRIPEIVVDNSSRNSECGMYRIEINMKFIIRAYLYVITPVMICMHCRLVAQMIGQPPWLGEYSGRILIRRGGSTTGHGNDAASSRVRSGSASNIVESLGLNFISKAFASRKGLPPTLGYVPAVSSLFCYSAAP
jgi:hypothetical protein